MIYSVLHIAKEQRDDAALDRKAIFQNKMAVARKVKELRACCCRRINCRACYMQWWRRKRKLEREKGQKIKLLRDIK